MRPDPVYFDDADSKAAAVPLADLERAGMKWIEEECARDGGFAEYIAELRAEMAGLPRRHVTDLRKALQALRAGFPDDHSDVDYFDHLNVYVHDRQATSSRRWPTQDAYKKACAALGLAQSGTKRATLERLQNAMSAPEFPAKPAKRRKKTTPGPDLESDTSDEEGHPAAGIAAAPCVHGPRVRERHGVSAAWQDQSSLHKNIYVDFGEGDVIDDFEEGLENCKLETAKITVQAAPRTEAERNTLLAGFWEVPRDEVKQVLQNSVSSLAASVVQQALDFDDSKLDATQRMVPTLMKHAIDSGDPLRMLLLGTAGTGKTASIGAALKVLATRWTAAGKTLSGPTSVGPFVVCSWTGVAAANVGFGGQTVCSVFKLQGNSPPEGEDFDAVCDALVDLELLVIDEVSMLEPDKLAAISELLNRVRRRNDNLRSAHFTKGFGAFSVLLAGDFAQLQPIGRSLLTPSRAGLSKLGKRLFDHFQDVVKLRRVYRQQCVDEFSKAYRDSTLRLRDSAPTAADLKLWNKMSLDAAEDAGQAAPFYDKDAVWLCSENKLAGARNADVLVDTAKKEARC